MLREAIGSVKNNFMIMPQILIRYATLKELPRVIQVTKQGYKIPHKKNTLITKSHEPEDIKERFLSKKFFVVVAIADNKIVGAVRYKIMEENLYLYQLAVLKKYRNKGIGSMLVNKIKNIAKRRKYKKILLDHALEKRLTDFYNRMGFKIYKIKKHQDHHDVYMSQRIN